jgi:hypothetical protein
VVARERTGAEFCVKSSTPLEYDRHDKKDRKLLSNLMARSQVIRVRRGI